MTDTNQKQEQKPAKQSSGSKVKNLSDFTMAIDGVSIRAGESAEVPTLDKQKAVIKAWIDAKVISVE